MDSPQVPGVSPEAAARIRSFYVETPPVDQEQLQREHPPPVETVEIRQPRMTLAEFKAYTRQETQRAREKMHASNRRIAAIRWGRPQRPAVVTPIRRQHPARASARRSSHTSRRSNRTRGPDDSEGDPPPDDPEGAPLHRVERPRRKSDLLPARVYVLRAMLRLVDAAQDGTMRRHEAVAGWGWDRSREGGRP